MNKEVTQVCTVEEVYDALQQMNLTKAPGLDEMAPIFYQKYWNIVGNNVTVVVLEALNSGEFPCTINHTFISLIPKKKKPTFVADYRSVSLCNVFYKLV